MLDTISKIVLNCLYKYSKLDSSFAHRISAFVPANDTVTVTQNNQVDILAKLSAELAIWDLPFCIAIQKVTSRPI